MKLSACVLIAVLVLFAIHSQTNALPADETHRQTSENCQGTNDRRCPLKLCPPNMIGGFKHQDNSKPPPECCGGPICSF